MKRARRWALRGGVAAAALALLAALAWHAAVRWEDAPGALLKVGEAQSLTVLDAGGRVLRQSAAAAGGRESWVPLSRVAPALQQATLAAEDHRFYRHAGVDWLAVGRAAWLDLRAGRMAYGASTISMQLARLLVPGRRGLGGKLRQALLAARIERRLSKRQILEQYFNRVYYGTGAWGAEAAARRYFGRPASALSLGEAALLAVLPRSPARYNPYRHFNRAIRRRNHILGLMARRGFISPARHRLALRTPLRFWGARPDFRAPHFVDLVHQRLPREQRRGAVVRTTLDGPLQRRLELAVRSHLDRVAWLNMTQAAVVVLRNRDGALLSLVGSGDYFDAAKNGAFNAATARLRPGSTLKPFVYALALERGDTAASVAYDVVLPGERGARYVRNTRQHGFARYRESLAGSYNLAAVHTLQRVGVRPLLERLRLAGLKTLDWPDHRYDAGLAVGYAEVRLLELTAAFAAFARGGRPLAPWAIRDSRRPGQSRWRPRRRARPRIFSPQVAYVIYHVLQDPDARRPMFGNKVPLHLPFPVALKTGTTRAYTDNWALGTTREYTVGVWAGNFDGAPTHGVISMRGATPLLRAAFSAVAGRFGEPTAVPRPPGIGGARVCAVSGMRPGPHCARLKHELFLPGTTPGEACTWHQRRCGALTTRYPPELHGWLRAKGRLPPPACPRATATAAAGLRIVYPKDGARFVLEPHRPPELQVPPLRAAPAHAKPRWTIDGVPAARWVPSPGLHRVRVSLGRRSDEVTISYEM